MTTATVVPSESSAPVVPASAPLPRWPLGPGGLAEVLRVAIPLMISSGSLSLVLFVDRTLLLRYDGSAMSAAMAGGNLFWTMICLPLGVASMTGAFVAQYVGVKRPDRVGRLLWQAAFLSLLTTPLWMLAAWNSRYFFSWSNQPAELLELEGIYFSVLMFGATAGILEAALSGFFSGTHRTMTVMWINVIAAALNVVLDIPLIFGWGGIPEMGIFGAGLASVISFWFKAIAYAMLLFRAHNRQTYALVEGFVWDSLLIRRLLFFGFPAGLQYLMEAGAFTLIVLQIGQIGDAALQATTMAINFNMIAFVPLIGVSIAASVLVGHHLTSAGPMVATRAAYSSLGIALIYSGTWAAVYLLAPEWLMSLYMVAGNIDPALVEPAGGSSGLGGNVSDTASAISIAVILLRFVAAYVLLDAAQMVLAGVLRGAGDTWFVLAATSAGSLLALLIGLYFEPADDGLKHWWYVITGWIWMLALLMSIRFWIGAWKNKRLVEPSLTEGE